MDIFPDSDGLIRSTLHNVDAADEDLDAVTAMAVGALRIFTNLIVKTVDEATEDVRITNDQIPPADMMIAITALMALIGRMGLEETRIFVSGLLADDGRYLAAMDDALARVAVPADSQKLASLIGSYVASGAALEEK